MQLNVFFYYSCILHTLLYNREVFKNIEASNCITNCFSLVDILWHAIDFILDNEHKNVHIFN